MDPMTDTATGTATGTAIDTRSEAGMVTAEYAVGTVAACGLAGVCLYPIFSSPQIRGVLQTLFEHALGVWW